jgi:predicted AlkP superfamily phosphohydrolase/phosphomutase
MKLHRTLAIGLDGYDPMLAEEMIRAGHMPRMAALRERCARFQLDHGDAKRTGLAWEHVSTGRSPEAYGRWSAVDFDPRRYEASQVGSVEAPFLRDVSLRSVVFDAPYFDLRRSPASRGVVSWGAHDPGIEAQASPPSLAKEIEARFGPYSATRFIYGFVWPDAALTREMGDALARALDQRTAVSRWLLTERIPHWDLALVVASEPHSGIEALWHGVDPCHPLHGLPSAVPAREGVVAIHQSVDRFVGTLADAFPDANVAIFSMHGMGPNRADVAGMLLLPELLYRHQFGRPWYTPRPEWAAAADGIPLLRPGDNWSEEVIACLGNGESEHGGPRALARGIVRRLRGRLDKRTRDADDLAWMPAAHYQRFWSQMDAFALPAFYEGAIRLNVVGRERHGRVPLSEYDARCDALCAQVEACRDAHTGEPVVEHITRPLRHDPLAASPTQPDLVVVWRNGPLAIRHPQLGLVGPAPFRRTGGHTGGAGMAYLRASELKPGDYGVRSAFDVVPTLLDLCGTDAPQGVSGASLLRAAPSGGELASSGPRAGRPTVTENAALERRQAEL